MFILLKIGLIEFLMRLLEPQPQTSTAILMLSVLQSPVTKLLQLKLITLSISNSASYLFSQGEILVGMDPLDSIKFKAISYFWEEYLFDNFLQIFLQYLYESEPKPIQLGLSTFLHLHFLKTYFLNPINCFLFSEGTNQNYIQLRRKWIYYKALQTFFIFGYFLYNIFRFKLLIQMGGSITVDKHTTNITDWIQVQNKLDQIQWNSKPDSHIKVWKFFQDSNNEYQINILPLQLDINKTFSLSPNECYVVCAINNCQSQESLHSFENVFLSSILHSIQANVIQQTYKNPVYKKIIQNIQYRMYSYIGKLSKPKMRLMVASYCLKFQNNLDSKKKLCILAGGGVLRNKKLQKGSTLPLFNQKVQLSSKQANENTQIDLLNLFKFGLRSKQQSIFSYKPKKLIPQISNPESNLQVKQQQTKKEQAKKIKNSSIGLKMNLKLDFTKNQDQQVDNQQQIQKDVSLTNRSVQAKGKRQQCQQTCSQIIEGLYVSGQKVAKNYQILKKHKIQAIINCAGDYCQNWHQDKPINYLTFFLKDSQNENIQCLFYRVIEFIQNAHKNKQNVLIHCIQGISRSVTLVIAYIIFKYGYDYKKAESFVKQKRVIACPNNGFMVELIQFHKRLYEDFEALPSPRVFLVSSHSKQTPHIVTARMIKYPLFEKKKYIGLDSRGVYVIHTHDLVYIWVGSKCQQKKLSIYWQYANQFSKKLQKYQRAPIKIKAISQGTQGRQFFNLWNLQQPSGLYQNSQYTDLFVEGIVGRPGQQRQYYEQAQEQQTHNRLFIYPDYKQGIGIFSWQDLSGLCILVRNDKHNNLILHLWRDQDQILAQKDEQFLDNVIEYNYANYSQEKIIIKQQNHEILSDQFTECMNT